MLSPKGKLAGDMTVSCLSEDRFLLLGSGTAQEMHRRWFEANLPADGGSYRNVSDSLQGMAIAGPKARTLLARLTRDDVSANAFRFRNVRRTFVAGVPVTLARLSFSGELGYEIYCAPQYLMRLWEALESAGQILGVKPYGARALMSMRLEKGWGVWTLEFRPDYTAAQSGMDAFIDWTKDFVGKAAVFAERATGPSQRLVTMVVETDHDVVGDEAILYEGTCIGPVTSGGYAHTAGVSVAMGYVRADLALEGIELQIEIDGKMRHARVVMRPLHDPDGALMRQ
jgi:dimethylglycine dehydrogenase